MKAFDAAPALAVPGVKEVFVVPQGVAVLADGFWAAKKGRDALKITWDESGTETRSSRDLVNEYRELAKKHRRHRAQRRRRGGAPRQAPPR